MNHIRERFEMRIVKIVLCIVVLLAGAWMFGLIPPQQLKAAVERRNFSGQATPSVIDTEYMRCNFAQSLPDPNLPNRVRIFPGDDTPRTFIRCNLVNCEVPPGSTVTKCNTSIVAPNMLIGSITVTIDGKSDSVEFYGTKFYRDGEWHIADSIPAIAEQSIDTAAGQYTSLLSGIETWRLLMQPRLKLFSMASDEMRKKWWNNDPLLKATLLILRDGAEFIERLEELDND